MSTKTADELAAEATMAETERLMRDPVEVEHRINCFDLTYGYSDDGSAYRAGSAQESWLRQASKFHDAEWFRTTYNAMVDRRLTEAYRPQFYWRGK